MGIDPKYLTDAKAWPLQEARRVMERIEARPPEKGYVLFETGYGPSGLPHIGTFGEVVRTTMVRNAFAAMCPVPSRLFAFSDDMDGLRKVPDNVPAQEMLTEHLGKPLTSIPDPFGTHESFGHHNNARLRAFLDSFGFEYEFKSATECYRSGTFDQTLLAVLRQHDDIRDVILPTLGEERRQTYSPFLPVCPKTGQVLQVPVVETKPDDGTLIYRDVDDALTETPVTGGRCKLQWKADWAMRWKALDVNYEMSGKDLIDSVKLSGRICRVLGGTPPEGFTYELFLDEKGEKISKSKGNGLAVEEWLRYAPEESLSLFMFQQPRRAKRLHFDVIPKNTDDYITFLGKYAEQAEEQRVENPVWHIHDGAPPTVAVPLTFGILLNLASVCNAEDKGVLWGFISRYAPEASPERNPLLDRLVGYALTYYQDFVKPAKAYRAPTDRERAALEDLLATLEGFDGKPEAEAIQNEVYEIGKRHGFENLRDWFRAQYETLLGQSQGPRMGSFIALYGVDETAGLIRKVLQGKSLSTA